MFIIQSVHLFERARPTTEGVVIRYKCDIDSRLGDPAAVHPLYPVVPYDNQMSNGMPNTAPPGSTTLNTVCMRIPCLSITRCYRLQRFSRDKG